MQLTWSASCFEMFSLLQKSSFLLTRLMQCIIGFQTRCYLSKVRKPLKNYQKLHEDKKLARYRYTCILANQWYVQKCNRFNMTKLQGHWGWLGTGARVSVCTKIKSWQLLPGMHRNFTCKYFTCKKFTCKNFTCKKFTCKSEWFLRVKTDM